MISPIAKPLRFVFHQVILRVQRPTHQTAVNVVKETRSSTGNTASKVKWQDEFEHHDNDRKFVEICRAD